MVISSKMGTPLSSILGGILNQSQNHTNFIGCDQCRNVRWQEKFGKTLERFSGEVSAEWHGKLRKSINSWIHFAWNVRYISDTEPHLEEGFDLLSGISRRSSLSIRYINLISPERQVP